MSRELIPRPMWMTGTAECDWTEDAPHENGQYFRHCVCCACDFIGHKRRHVCRRCEMKSRAIVDAMSPEEREEHYRKRDEAIAAFLKGSKLGTPYFEANLIACEQRAIELYYKNPTEPISSTKALIEEFGQEAWDEVRRRGFGNVRQDLPLTEPPACDETKRLLLPDSSRDEWEKAANTLISMCIDPHSVSPMTFVSNLRLYADCMEKLLVPEQDG